MIEEKMQSKVMKNNSFAAELLLQTSEIKSQSFVGTENSLLGDMQNIRTSALADTIEKTAFQVKL